MNIMSVGANGLPENNQGSSKTQTEGTDLFSILMASIGAANLPQQVGNEILATGGIDGASGGASSAQIMSKLNLSWNIPGIEGKAGDVLDALITDPNVASLINQGKSIDPELLKTMGQENGKNQNPFFMSSVADGLGKKESENPLDNVSAKEGLSSAGPIQFSFLEKSGNDPGGKNHSDGLNGIEFKVVKEEGRDILPDKADAQSDLIPVFNHNSADSGAVADVKINKASTGLPVEPSRLVEQVSDGFRSAVKSGDGHVRIELHPESLGHLKIEVKVQEGIVRANIMAENAMVKDTIDANMSTLRKSLEDQGLRIDQLSVGIDLRQGGSSFAEREQFQMRQAFSESSLPYKGEEKPSNEPLYRVNFLRNDAVSIFA